MGFFHNRLTDKMLSIIIPVYNAERYIKSCVDSILQQSSHDFELLLIDDGSSDGSGVICDDFAKADKRVRVLHKPNGGVSAARNLGIENARGEWMSFVDADDLVESGYVSDFLRMESKADLTFFPHAIFSGDSIEKQYEMPDSYENERARIEASILHLKDNEQQFEFFGYTWNKFFRSDIIRANNIRFIPGLKFREDEFFTAQYCRYISSIATLSKPLYRYRKGTGGLTSHPMKSVDFLQLAELTEHTTSAFSYEPLVRYENYRIMYMLHDALSVSSSWYERYCIAKRIRAFSIRVSANYDATRLPFGLVKNAKSPLRLLLWWVRRGKSL